MSSMMKPMKVFLSGPISSRMETYKAEFDDAARIVIEAGHLPLNPATLPIGMESRDYMRICLAMLDSADLLLQLPGWGKSAGAIAERTVAMKTGVESLTLEDFIREYGPERVPAEPESGGRNMLNIRKARADIIDLAILKAAIQDGRGPEMICPFDEIDIPLDTGKIITATCAFVNSDLARFVFKDCLDEGQMNDTATNKTGYFWSMGRRHILEDIYPHLPQELRDMIRPRKITETINGELKEYADPLWLPSATDLFGAPEEKWWPDEPDSFQLPIFLKERDRVKECLDKGTWFYWLRSVFASNAAGFCLVSTDGGAGSSSAYLSRGFAPGFDL